MNRRRVRRAVVALHRWLAFAAGAFVLVAGVTGSILVFRGEIDRILDPDMLVSQGGAARLSIGAAADRIDEGLTVRRVSLPSPQDDGVYLFEASDGDRVLEIAVDPYTGAILGQRPVGSTFTAFVYELHRSLFLGRAGEIFLALIGAALLISVGTGLWLWWPRAGPLRRALTWRRTRSPVLTWFDLHKLTGVYLAAVLLPVALTGILLTFPDYWDSAVAAVAEVTEIPTAFESAPKSRTSPDIGPGVALAAANEVLPEGKALYLVFPLKDRAPYLVAMSQPGELRDSGAYSGVAVDRYTGDVLSVIDSRNSTAGDVIRDLPYPLHTGEVFSLPGRLVVFASGLASSALFLTGLRLWWLRRSPPRTAVGRSAAS